MTRARLLVIGAVVALVAAVLTVIVRASDAPDLVLKIQPIADDSTVTVYVGGAVRSAGLYTLPRGARVADALATAVVLPDADVTGIPMAGRLADGQQVLVPRRAPAASPVSAVSASPPPTGPVNVNTASAAELESLPGIGPTLSQRIVEYRTQHGPFANLDALDQVRGISARMVDEWRGLATTGN
ncbi:MAG TPA: ComEA family DNA-binding protein [Thermomicrobiaceae bacterium]|nr:ComEA family DNA-binding protein [Thermomicrobiaceae bacterium]